MELHAYTRTISDLFSVKKKYIVPRFQREYSWTKEQVLELWNDIISNISIKDGDLEHTEYFIGSLVLVGDDKSISLQIVDGQQRLTTITILLSALCQRFLELKKDKIAKSIYDNYIAGKDDEGEDYFKLQNETPKPFFQTTIQDINKEENNPSSQEEKCLLSSYKDTFTNKFSRLKFVKGCTKHKKLIQYIFSYIELFKQTTSEFQPDSITLEHILSQSEGNKDYIGSIGNLLPLGSDLNEKAGKKKLTEKVKIYEQSNFAITREFARKGVKDWGEQEIQSRTFELAEYCYDHIWKIG